VDLAAVQVRTAPPSKPPPSCSGQALAVAKLLIAAAVATV
jgi:hypothetical protein